MKILKIFLCIFLPEVRKHLQSSTSTKRTKSNNYKTFVLFQLFILQIKALLVYFKGFPSLDIRNHLNSIKILRVTKIFLKLIHIVGIRIKQISTLFSQCGSTHRGREGEGFLFSWSYNFIAVDLIFQK